MCSQAHIRECSRTTTPPGSTTTTLLRASCLVLPGYPEVKFANCQSRSFTFPSIGEQILVNAAYCDLRIPA